MLSFNHFFVAIKAGDPHTLCGSNGVSAAGADILAAAGRLYNRAIVPIVGACSCDSETEAIVAADQDIGQAICNNEVHKLFSGFGDRPTAFITVGDVKPSCFGGFHKALVVVGVAPAAILNPFYVVVVVDHFVQQRGSDVFDGPR